MAGSRRVLDVTRRRKRLSVTRWIFPYLFLLPTFVLIGVFSYYPAASALYHSFTDWNGITRPRFLWLDNFAEMTGDKTLVASLSNMGIVTAWSLFITLTMPFLVAELIYAVRNERASYWYRLLFVIPIVVPWVVTLLVWSFIYNPDVGLLSAFTKAIGITKEFRWLGDPNMALYCLMFIGFPFAAGTNVLIYLAGLQGIDESIIDAASLDGAVGFRRVIHVDLPMISGQIRLLAVLAIIGGIQGYGSQYVLTRGGPGYATMVPGMWLYTTAFTFMRMGYASAIGTAMFLVILGLTVATNSDFNRSNSTW